MVNRGLVNTRSDRYDEGSESMSCGESEEGQCPTPKVYICHIDEGYLWGMRCRLSSMVFLHVASAADNPCFNADDAALHGLSPPPMPPGAVI